MKNHVITARIDQDTFFEMQSLKESHGFKETTEVISFALHRLFKEDKEKSINKSPFELMEEAGLIGCIDDASVDGSREARKREMMNAIEKKIHNRAEHG